MSEIGPILGQGYERYAKFSYTIIYDSEAHTIDGDTSFSDDEIAILSRIGDM
jgi:hypothetical protein